MDVIKPVDHDTLILLKAYQHRMTPQQYKTLRGQVLAGNAEAAKKGLRKILRKEGTP